MARPVSSRKVAYHDGRGTGRQPGAAVFFSFNRGSVGLETKDPGNASSLVTGVLAAESRRM